ncbi:NAD-dependent protein deacetylase sirtuin-3, mitochondrial isoform X2 [Chanodichthys erythropterus]|uniref:NAD-dependent protein deacetylase sirtuin-3, mitochondrial isoform X2 n=1 Tax=Chanodichthys erythropterus TaxID=933992 RepID=UPI00351E7D33
MLYLKTSMLTVCRRCFTDKLLWRRGLSTTQNLSRTNLSHQNILSHFPHAKKNAVFLSQFVYCPAAFTRGLFGGGRGSVHQQTLKDIAENIRERKFRRIVVMAGAGISTPSGIPDFRSPGSGLYDNLQQYNLPYAEAIFEINYFHHNPNPFFALAKELYPGNYRPNLTHYFIRLLHDKGQLLRMYTQNIDGLERMAGIPPEMLVEAHGTFATATCTVCRRDYQGEELRNDIMEGKIPKCPTCKGIVKPDIVFFGEELPQQFFSYLTDFPVADLLIVMGTSLEQRTQTELLQEKLS